MKWLVTGGLGVVGSEFARARLTAGDEVTIIDACEEPRNSWLAAQLTKEFGERAQVITRRLETALASPWLLHAFDGAGVVLHAAAHTGIPHSSEDPNDDWASNVDATRAILKVLHLLGKDAPPTVVLSSVKPYGLQRLGEVAKGQQINAVDEDFPMDPDEPYAGSKLAQSAIAQAFARAFDLPIVVFRCSNLYGPAPCHGFGRHGWLTWFCIQAALGWPITVEGSGEQSRDMLYTDDVIRAVLLAVEKIGATRGKTFNVGGGVANVVSVNQAVAFLDKLRPVTSEPIAKIARGEPRKNDDHRFVTDHRRFTEATGWLPNVSVEGGIGLVFEWARRHADELKGLYTHA